MKSHFQPIQSPVRMRAILKELVSKQTRVRLWPRGRKPPVEGPEAGSAESVLEAEFRLTGMSAGGQELYCTAVESREFRKYREWTSGPTGNSFIVTIQSPLGLLFMNTSASELRANSIRLHAPMTVYEVQRRSALRVRIPEQLTIRLACDDPHLPKQGLLQDVFDLGEGGLSFLIPESKGKAYSRGLELGTVRFTLAGRLIQCQAVVRSRRKGRNRSNLGATVIGVQFMQLHEADRAWISAWVLRQSRYIVQGFRS